MNILLGASGTIGTHIISQPHITPGNTILLTRNPDALAARYAGFTVKYADLSKKETLNSAFSGGDNLILLSPNNPNMYLEQCNAIDAAVTAGIKRIVKISATPTTVSSQSKSSVGLKHWRVEQYLQEHFNNYSILRCNFFMQNLLGTVANNLKRSNSLITPFSVTTPFCFLDAKDIAECLVCLLNKQISDKKIYNLSGNPSSFLEVKDLIATLTDRHISYKRVPLWISYMALRWQRCPHWLASHQLQMAKLFNQGHAGHEYNDIKALLKRSPTPLADFLQRNIHYFKAS